MKDEAPIEPCGDGAVGAVPLLVVAQPYGVVFWKLGVVSDGQFQVVSEHACSGLQGLGFAVPMHVGSRKMKVVYWRRCHKCHDPAQETHPPT